jgi:hypothetical protein
MRPVNAWESNVQRLVTETVLTAEPEYIKMSYQTLIDSLYEELIYLDEIAGEYDEMTNHAIDYQREKIMKQIQELEAV